MSQPAAVVQDLKRATEKPFEDILYALHHLRLLKWMLGEINEYNSSRPKDDMRYPDARDLLMEIHELKVDQIEKLTECLQRTIAQHIEYGHGTRTDNDQLRRAS